MRRRQYLAAVTGGGIAAAAGCLGGLTDAGRRPLAENPIGRYLDDRPRLGPGRDESEIVLVEVYDPSCPGCASFHEGAFQRIESEWIDEGRASAYTLARPTVDRWGELAMHALFEVHAREPALVWVLKGSYYANRDELTAETIGGVTEAALDGTGVDVAAVTDAIETEAHAPAIEADVEAADEAGVNGVPTVFVFVDDTFVTTLGSGGFDAYESAVESHA